MGPSGWLPEMLPSGQTCPAPSAARLAPAGPGQMSAAVISMGWRQAWQYAHQTQRPLESPLSLGQGRGAVQAKGRGDGAPRDHKDLPKLGDAPSFSWDLPPQCHCSAGFPSASTQLSFSHLSFSFSLLHLVSCACPTRLASPVLQPLSALKKCPSSHCPKEMSILPVEASLQERLSFSPCFSGSYCLEVPP